MSENPYEVVGARFTPEEYELVQMGLTGIASHAKDSGETAVYNKTVDLMTRLEQYVVAGQGVPEAMTQGFAERLQKAMQEQNSKAIIVLLRNWMATLIRLEPDPARSIARHLTDMMLQAQAGNPGGGNAKVMLEQVAKKFEALRKMYAKSSSWPKGDALLKHLSEWIEYGKANMEAGREPWAGDPSVQ